MFAIIETGGKQYMVEKGQVIEVEKIEGKEGATVEIDRVLFVGGEGKARIGKPFVEGARVKATILAQKRGPKVIVFKKKAKTGYKKKQGHRQYLTVIRIEEIIGGENGS